MSNRPGELYVVATPIGNLADFSPRAVEILKSVNTILAEDTRHSKVLLHHFGIKTPCSAIHEHNERSRVQQITAKLLAGESLAIISDSGTPLVSDPGYPVVFAAIENSIRVVPIPGACAAVAALSVAGLPSDRFAFEGFLPSKAQQRKNYLETLKRETRTLIFYEAPHRIIECLTDCCEIFGGDREATIARELTKIHETVRRSTLATLFEWVSTDPNQQKGEIVLVISGFPKEDQSALNETIPMLEILLEELPLKQAVQITARLSGQPKNKIYDLALSLNKK